MTLSELIDEVQEHTHAGEIEIACVVLEAWPDGRDHFTETQCALVERALRGASASPKSTSPLRRL